MRPKHPQRQREGAPPGAVFDKELLKTLDADMVASLDADGLLAGLFETHSCLLATRALPPNLVARLQVQLDSSLARADWWLRLIFGRRRTVQTWLRPAFLGLCCLLAGFGLGAFGGLETFGGSRADDALVGQWQEQYPVVALGLYPDEFIGAVIGEFSKEDQ